jgi:hypothetical protein
MLLSERLWKNANHHNIQALGNQVIAPSKPQYKKTYEVYDENNQIDPKRKQGTFNGHRGVKNKTK